MRILGIIPARYASSRLAGKPLAMIAGKSMIQRVYEQCTQAEKLTEVIIATDDERILQHVLQFTDKVIMTSASCRNGTERCAEVVSQYVPEFDFIVNIQGDEPFINPKQIDELCALFDVYKNDIYTQVKPETNEALYSNKNVVKAILDEQTYALDFFRETVELFVSPFYKHIGIYGFKPQTLLDLVKLPPSQREQQLHLEQLRWLDNGYAIKAGITAYHSMSIDTADDLAKAIKYAVDFQN